MWHKALRAFVAGTLVALLAASPFFMTGCEPKREKKVHVEHKSEKVVHEGPVVE